MAVSHHHTLSQADFIGTVTVFNSLGATTTIAGTDLWRPSDGNSVHDEFYTLGGNTLLSSTASGKGINWAGSGGVSLIGSSDSIVISSPANATIYGFEPYPLNNGSSFASIGQSSLYLQHMVLPLAASFDRVARLASLSFINPPASSNHTGGMTNLFGFTETIGLYTRMTGASSGSFSLLTSSTWSMGLSMTASINSGGATTVSLSQSAAFGFPSVFDTAGGYTSGTFSSTGSTSSGSTSVSMSNILSNITGPVVMQIPFGITMSAAEYLMAFLGVMGSSTTGSAANIISISDMFLSGLTSGIKNMGTTSTGTNARFVIGNGVFTAQTGALPASIARANIGNNSLMTKHFVLGFDL